VKEKGMSKKCCTWVCGLLAGLTLAGLSLGACARLGAMKGPFDGDRVNLDFVERMTYKTEKRLDLDPEQRERCRAMYERLLTSALAQRKESQTLKTQLAEALRKERLDQAEVDRLLEGLHGRLRAVLDSVKPDLAALHATLDAQQREKLAELVLEHGRNACPTSRCW
jgi:uncharacterized membrane protein